LRAFPGDAGGVVNTEDERRPPAEIDGPEASSSMAGGMAGVTASCCGAVRSACEERRRREGADERRELEGAGERWEGAGERRETRDSRNSNSGSDSNARVSSPLHFSSHFASPPLRFFPPSASPSPALLSPLRFSFLFAPFSPPLVLPLPLRFFPHFFFFNLHC
jgi:hypothetical protein